MATRKKKKDIEKRVKSAIQTLSITQKTTQNNKLKNGRESSRGRRSQSKENNGRKTRASSRSSGGQSRASLRLRSSRRKKVSCCFDPKAQ